MGVASPVRLLLQTAIPTTVAEEYVLTLGKLTTCDNPRSRLGLPAGWCSCVKG
jgi:hypothetical protein